MPGGGHSIKQVGREDEICANTLRKWGITHTDTWKKRIPGRRKGSEGGSCLFC